MAITRGHGNPNWTRDEVVLALDLYFDCDGRIPGPADARVRELSAVLRAFPHHSVEARMDSFRNPAGVAFKLQNLRQVATGLGLANVSRVDRAIWDEFGRNPEGVKQAAALIREGIETIYETADVEDDNDVFPEGRVVTETHKRRERNPKLRAKLLSQRMGLGELKCECCGDTAMARVASLHDAIFEAHHILPLAAGQERRTRLEDLALVCANCHRLIHRAIAQAKRWVSIAEVKHWLGRYPTR